MSYPNKEVKTVDGIEVVCKSFKTNIRVYKEIGGEVTVKVSKKKAKEIVDFVRIKNQYFHRVGNTPYVVPMAEQNKERAHKKHCKAKHWAVGIGVKVKYSSEGVSLGAAKVPRLLPLNGVITTATVRINGKDIVLTTAKGPHPEGPVFVE